MVTRLTELVRLLSPQESLRARVLLAMSPFPLVIPDWALPEVSILVLVPVSKKEARSPSLVAPRLRLVEVPPLLLDLV